MEHHILRFPGTMVGNQVGCDLSSAQSPRPVVLADSLCPDTLLGSTTVMMSVGETAPFVSPCPTSYRSGRSVAFVSGLSIKKCRRYTFLERHARPAGECAGTNRPVPATGGLHFISARGAVSRAGTRDRYLATRSPILSLAAPRFPKPPHRRIRLLYFHRRLHVPIVFGYNVTVPG
ncbi:hypothetical protein EVAR_41321_1 [Eumeta japonica]|uniref:Uncharacterized protein n=1 Tax=Eumeta variegata TaxID=151549 RepID=A0A4C1X101_EUMVA|nr:hypothetical protein EVAR_41321_1 [Eumeta japonica]